MSISLHSSMYMITFLQLSHICFPLIYLDTTTTTAMTPSVSGKKVVEIRTSTIIQIQLFITAF